MQLDKEVRFEVVKYYEVTELQLVIFRWETDEEFAKRKAEEAAARRKRQARLKKEAKERAEYERLKKKFEK